MQSGPGEGLHETPFFECGYAMSRSGRLGGRDGQTGLSTQVDAPCAGQPFYPKFGGIATEIVQWHFAVPYSSNIGTWRWSSVRPRRGRRVAPITARTVSDSRAVRGTKMRCVFERWSGGLTR